MGGADNGGKPTVKGMEQEFDLRPDPRVLPMLGEVNLEQWRCLGELIDNSVDGFLHSGRSGTLVADPEVYIDLPTADREGAIVRVRDNGPGMTPEVLQNAVSAGWSGNNPIDNLGLFGMGFNIATARLGSITQVWTTKRGEPEWHGLEIDFDKLRRQRHFRTAHLRRPKPDHAQQGTEVTITKLKPEQRAWLARNANQSALRKRLSQTYASMLRADGVPVFFKLFLNNKKITPFDHCHWSASRSVKLSDIGEVAALIQFDHALANKPYCINCMNWVTPDVTLNEPCPVCQTSGSLSNRSRRIKGWLGIQRYLHKTDFGFDFIRNGRKIEIANKELFLWKGEDGEEPEYPIDDQRGRGRIIGEVHIDHCRVSYSKDRFDRSDPSWDEMVQIIRGPGPLRPEKAKSLGITDNQSPLFRIFKAFRRTSPQAKVAGAWQRILTVPSNDRAQEMAGYFHDGKPEYQEDTKWWELIEEADRALLKGGDAPSTPPVSPTPPVPDIDLPPGLLDPAGPAPIAPPQPTPAPVMQRREVPSLTRTYTHGGSGLEWRVKAFEVTPPDPDVPSGAPWVMRLADLATRTYQFLFDRNHAVFRSLTLTPNDALLMELTWMAADYLRTEKAPPPTSVILANFRNQYATDTNLDLRQMQIDALELLSVIARGIVRSCPEHMRSALFDELDVEEREIVMRSLAAKKIKPTDVIKDGAFLLHSPPELTTKFIRKYPEYCFDQKIWDEPYDTLDYGSPEITRKARSETLGRYIALLDEVVWLSRQESSSTITRPREELVRALMSLKILRPDTEET